MSQVETLHDKSPDAGEVAKGDDMMGSVVYGGDGTVRAVAFAVVVVIFLMGMSLMCWSQRRHRRKQRESEVPAAVA